MDKKMMLIVDDNEVNQGLLLSIFEDDFIVKCANDGATALDLMERFGMTLSIVLLDLVMPDMDGFAVLAKMQENPTLRSIPVVVVSGQTEREASLRAVRCGAVDFATKPVDPDWLEIKVAAAISRAENVNKLRFQAERDTLTGLYNRATFFEKADELIAAREPGFYVMTAFDINQFKVINDQYGTQTGDDVLKEVARIHAEEFGSVGGLTGRISGDNFAVVYPVSLLKTDRPEKMIKAITTPLGSLPPISFSVGRYRADDLSLSASAMYDRAVLAKASIKGRYDSYFAWYDESMREQLLREQRIVNDMKPALEQGQFEVWLQPQYNHVSGALIGAEALVRWRHPVKGMVSPGVFIPIFERNGFVYELDKYVWEQSCVLLRRWMDAGHEPLPISVNISRYDLFNEDLDETIVGLVAQYNIPKDMLRLEITESAFAESSEQVVRAVKRLIETGFTVEIDDFGSGYSSLNTLKDVPAQVLKLDMRFLENSDDAGRGGNVLESVVRMAKWLGMAVIAEGVEKIEQADYLKSIGCAYVQGFLYAKPMPVAEYETLALEADKESRLLRLQTVKNLNNNSFWDPMSMDTLIFNSYVGSATITEYYNGKIEVLRATDKFAKMLGSETMSVEDALKLDWAAHLQSDSLTAFVQAVYCSVETGDEITIECILVDLPGCPNLTYLRTTLRVIATAGEHFLLYCTNVNITEQREIEAKERASAEQLQAIMDNINGSVTAAVVRDGMPEFLFVNEQFYSMHGYTKEQYIAEIGNSALHIFYADREKLMTSIRKASADGRPFSVIYRIVRRDGALRWLQSNIAIINLPGVEENVQLSVSNDITELREAEEKERASAEQLQTIMANINGGVTASVVENGVPRILFANDRFYSQYGYTKEQFEAEVKNPHNLLHPDDAERVTRETTEASATNRPFFTVCRIIRRDGSVCWLQTNVTIMHLPGVDAPVQLAVAADITVQKELEAKEHANAAQLQAIMDNINGGVSISVMRDGFPKIIFANEQFYAQRGYTKEQYEAEVSDSSMIFHPDDLERTSHTARTATGSHSEIYRILRRDGEVRWIQNNITEVNMPGYNETVKLSVCNDITELRKAERKEHEVSERLQAILAALNSGVSAVTTGGDGRVNYIFANDMFYSMLGLTKEQFELEGSDVMALIHTDDRERIDAQLAALMKDGGTTVFEYRVIRPDNETIHLRVNASLLSLDGVDKPVVLGVSSDVTEMVMVQKKISDLSERMETILENVDSGITAAEVDVENVGHLFGNDRFFELHGYTKEQYEAEVENIFDLVHPEDRQRVIDTDGRVNETGESVTMEYRIIRRDGEQRWMRTRIAVRSLPDAKFPVQFSVYNDISEEKLAQDKLRVWSEQLQTMMDDMPGGFVRLRVLPGGNVATEYVNDNFCRMRGLTRETILSDDGQDAMATIHPDDVELMRGVVMDMVASGETRSIQYRLRHANGTYIPFSVFGRVTVGDDGEKHINVYYANLSEQEKKEQTIRETVPLVLSSILASSTNLAFAKDRDSRYICGSAEFMKMTTFTHASEIIGKTDHEIFPKEIADILRANDMMLLETGTPMLDYVQALPLADGSLHYYKLSKYVLRDTFGNMLGVYGIGRDITEEKSAYARLKLLVDSIPGGIASYISTPEGIRITYFNDGFCNMFGYTHDEYEQICSTGNTNITFAEDVPQLMEKVDALIRDGVPVDHTYRVHTKDGGYKWVHMRGAVSERHGDICFLNSALYDVTERMETEAALRMSEQEFRIAAAIGGRTVARYDIKTRTYQHTSKLLLSMGFERRIENVPQTFIEAGVVAQECLPEYLAFYDKLRRGESPCSVDIAIPGENGTWLWFREEASVMFDADEQPAQAIIVFSDITEQREKETVFIKWQQSLRERPEESYTLFRCNLSKNGSFDSVEGKLFWVTFATGGFSFNDRTQEYTSQCVCQDDRAEYLEFLDSDTLLANYYRGVHTKALEYREALPDGTLRWLRLTVELVEYPNSTDVEAFLLYENIDTGKRNEMRTRELAHTDPLTGTLNRASFSQAMDRILSDPKQGGNHAILMLDIDTFKKVNDTLGHDMGDQVLKETAEALRDILRRDDLLGRLGGDEFLVCMRDVNDEEAIKRKVEQICMKLNRALTLDVQTSTSIGIAVCPRDGRDFATLYRKADTALYKVKASGKNSFAFFEEGMETVHNNYDD